VESAPSLSDWHRHRLRFQSGLVGVAQNYPQLPDPARHRGIGSAMFTVSAHDCC
jgi:hypothetical protein